MADTKDLATARGIFDNLCTAIEKRKWKYDKDASKLLVHFEVTGEDIPMKFIMMVIPGHQIINLISPMPFKMKENKRVEGAIATCIATYGLPDGCFDYNIDDGSIMLRLTASYRGSLIGEELFQYMISYGCAVVDKYNDQFMGLNAGMLSIDDIIAKEKE